LDGDRGVLGYVDTLVDLEFTLPMDMFRSRVGTASGLSGMGGAIGGTLATPARVRRAALP
jgi:hypothetical protein